jgi:hypothetical protein
LQLDLAEMENKINDLENRRLANPKDTEMITDLNSLIDERAKLRVKIAAAEQWVAPSDLAADFA